MNNDLLAQRRAALAQAVPGRRWYSIVNTAGPVAEVRIYDEISAGAVTADDFARELEAITAPEIAVGINSPGGDVFDAIAIYNALKRHKARITTRVDGIAASAASVIVQAGDKRVMMSAAQMMIHEAWGIAIGPAEELRSTAAILEKETGVLARIYAERGVGNADHYLRLMKASTWFTDREAVSEGLADEIFNGAVDDEIRKEIAAIASKVGVRYAEDRETTRVQLEIMREKARFMQVVADDVKKRGPLL